MSSYAEGQYELAKVDMLRRRLESRLAESGAAPDAELDRLLKRALNGAMRHGEGVHNATPAECLKCGEAISAIHAHVAQVKREARAEGERAATGEVSEGARLIAAERQRQLAVEGWTPEHDDQYTNGELAKAAACYALDGTTARAYDMEKPTAWPWERAWWKPGSYQRNLEKAGALIAAEIERLLRRDKEGV